MSKRNDKNSAKMSLSLSRSAAQLYCIMMKTLCLHGKLYEFLFLQLTRIFIYSGSSIDFPKVLRRISFDLSRLRRSQSAASRPKIARSARQEVDL